MYNPKSFETERLYIKPTTSEDAKFIFELMNSPKWLTYIGDRAVNSIDDAKAYIAEKMTPQLARLGFATYTVIRKTDDQKIGSVGLYDRDGLDGIDIGFAFLPKYEQKGYAFESASKLKSIAFEHFKINKLNAITVSENVSSQKLIEKLGFTYIKTIEMSNDDTPLLLFQSKA